MRLFGEPCCVNLEMNDKSIIPGDWRARLADDDCKDAGRLLNGVVGRAETKVSGVFITGRGGDDDASITRRAERSVATLSSSLPAFMIVVSKLFLNACWTRVGDVGGVGT